MLTRRECLKNTTALVALPVIAAVPTEIDSTLVEMKMDSDVQYIAADGVVWHTAASTCHWSDDDLSFVVVYDGPPIIVG